ncbi:MAG TPA: arginine deiminase family protein [Thermomicrobiales bacterium]|nr:arginine deiminase family protein [Thermomicrobiales bacterium]
MMAEQYGGHSMIAPLRRVLVRKPAPPAGEGDAARFNYPNQPNHDVAVREHDAFVRKLQELGVDVIEAEAAATGELDAIFVYDPSFTTDGGLLLMRPGKVARASEVEMAREAAFALDIPIIGEIQEPGTVEGGDMLWLDQNTLAIGEGYRTNAAGIDQVQIFLRPVGVDVVRMALPYWHGPDECLHLMSLISPVAEKLAVVYKPLMSVPFVQFLEDEGWSFVEIPDEEFATQGSNVLAIEPGKVLMLKDNPVTIDRLRKAGVEVHTYTGDEISHNRAGGPTCLTRPILRRTLTA